MKKSLKILLILFLIIPFSAKALTANNEYIITGYDVNIMVNENNTFHITEKIDAYFKVEKHGIFRKIPLKNIVNRLDGTSSKNHAEISNIMVSNDYTTYIEKGNKVIKIGDPNITFTGSKPYKISYLYNIGKDPLKNKDELYLNIIGDGWDTSISGITFTIIMPKEFDKSKIGFSSGSIGSTENSNILYTVEGNVIKGSYRGMLLPNEALTIRIELPEKYFVGAHISIDLLPCISIIISIMFVIISYYLWYKYGRDEKTIDTVEFYPPEGLNSAEMAFFYRGKIFNDDITSLLIYLANKGYIKIVEVEEASIFKNFKYKTYIIKKVKEYDGDNLNEKLFLAGLFCNKKLKNYGKYLKNPQLALEDEIEYLDEVKIKDLHDKFYTTVGLILANISKKENKEKIFEKNSIKQDYKFILMIIVTVLLTMIIPFVKYGMNDRLIPAGMFTFVFLIVIIGLKNEKLSTISPLLTLISPAIVLSMVWILLAYLMISVEINYLYSYLIGIVSIIIMALFNYYSYKRTKYGNEILGKIKGFKNFLEVAEKPQLEEQVEKNPSYFYNILPYTYVLGISTKWMSKFNEISVQSPEWYSGTTDFDLSSFSSSLESTMSSFSDSSSSSDGGSSGGGSSGGGSGGGGGGSW